MTLHRSVLPPREANHDTVPAGYVPGLGRDVPHPRVAHLYHGTFDDPGLPMCPRGWNRGDSYSIWRNNVGSRGVCKRCLRRAKAGLPPVHSTKTPRRKDRG
jgi:hypothetical protein